MDAASSERNLTFFRFEDLRIYHKALDYMAWVHKATQKFPDSVQDNIGIRFNESARAIALNIAEGSARNKSQFIYYLKMAKSSVRECVVLTTIAHQNGFLAIEKEEESRNFLIEISKMVGALIASLQRSKRPDEDEEDPEPVPGLMTDPDNPNLY